MSSNTDTKPIFERALGREPRDFGEFTRETAASGVWDAASHGRARLTAA